MHIEYVITGEEGIIEFENKKELDDFLTKEDVEVIDLSNEPVEETAEIREDPIKEEKADDYEETSASVNHEMILNSLNSEETYVKYHIHTVTMEDTIENICSKYSINLNTLKKYNTFDNLELNMKLLIPENEES